MNCKDMETQAVCLRSADGSTLSAVAHYEYGLDAGSIVLNASTRFTDPSGSLIYDIADYESVSVGVCEKDRLVTPACVKKRNFIVGYDNGLTLNSVTNECGERANLIRFNQDFEVLGWMVNGSEVGAGQTLGGMPDGHLSYKAGQTFLISSILTLTQTQRLVSNLPLLGATLRSQAVTLRHLMARCDSSELTMAVCLPFTQPPH